MKLIHGKLIWKSPKPYGETMVPDPEKIRLEFPHVIHFKGHWYCTFREAQIHFNHWSGTSRVIRSADGVNWESVALFGWDSADVGLSRFSITAEGHLMVNALVAFVSREPREDGCHYQLDKEKYLPAPGWSNWAPCSDIEEDVAQQSVTWVSVDGLDWGTAFACPTGVNTQRVDVTWHDGMGYSVGYGGKDPRGTLYRTRDGKSWRVLKHEVFSKTGVGENESDLAFTPDGTACCVARCGAPRVMIGVSRGPYYQDWVWKKAGVDWNSDGTITPASQIFRVDMGGPDIIRVSDGRLLLAARWLGPERPGGPLRIDPSDPEGREDGSVMLFWVDAHSAVLTPFVEVDGTSYPGICEHNRKIWVSYIGGDRSGVFLAEIDLE